MNQTDISIVNGFHLWKEEFVLQKNCLLRDDGLILISIDDYEDAQLKLLCDCNFWGKQQTYHHIMFIWHMIIPVVKLKKMIGSQLWNMFIFTPKISLVLKLTKPSENYNIDEVSIFI